MKSLIDKNKGNYHNLCGVLNEIEWKHVDKMDKDFFRYTLATEVVLFCMLKYFIRKMIKNSKVDAILSRDVSDITLEKVDIRILRHPSLNSFSDDKGTIFVTSGLAKLLSQEEIIAVCLHEIGHGTEKLKLLYEKMLKMKNIKLFSFMAPLIKKKLNSDALNKTTLYLVCYMIYMSSGQPPFKGTYKWSYGDLAIKKGYWDHYESAIYKIDRYLYKNIEKNQSKLANKLTSQVQKVPQTGEELSRPMEKAITDKQDSLLGNIRVMMKTMKQKIDKSMIGKAIRAIT